MKNKLDNMYYLRKYIYDRADNYCNQKYDNIHPYSFHLRCVEQQGLKFKHLILLPEDWEIVQASLINHENIEDFRMTYNDVKEVCNNFYFQKIFNFGERVSDIIYAVTDEKGKTRLERKNEKYYKELSENNLAVFVKLSDISANTLYSKLTNSSMYKKYKSEFEEFKRKCYVDKYKEFFDYVNTL